MLRPWRFVCVLLLTTGCGNGSTDPEDRAPTNATVDTPVCMHPVRTVTSLVTPPGGVLPAADTPVVVRTLVVTSGKFLVRSIPGNGCIYGFWASDGTMAQTSHGILVTGRGNDIPSGATACPATSGGGRIQEDLAVGDTVDVSGEYIGYHSATARCADAVAQLEDLCAVTRRAQGATVVPLGGVDPGDLGDDAATTPSAYQGVLVTTLAATVTDPDPDHDGKFFVVTGSHSALRVSTLLLARSTGYHPPAAGTRFTALTGVAYRDTCHWQLVPRSSSDLSVAP